MEAETSWVSHCNSNSPNHNVDFDSFSDLNEVEAENEILAVSLDLILPDDLLERILTCLPIASIFRAGAVCKRWHDIVTSRRFLINTSNVLYSQKKPWYFMFTSSDEPIGYAYDPILRKWYNIELPCINTSNLFIASSCGLVCFMDKDSRNGPYLCNPITKSCCGLNDPPGPKFSDYSSLAVSVDRASFEYEVSVVKCKEIPGNFFQWDLSICVYSSRDATWTMTLNETLTGWRAGEESVICGGVLYFLIYSVGGVGPAQPEARHGLLAYNLMARPVRGALMGSFVHVPCPLTCGRLMGIGGKLVMVGGIGKPDRPGIIKGIGVWALEGKEWREMARVPHKYFQGFGELDDVFASSGTDDLIYIHSYGSPMLLVFDVSLRQWKWSQKSPVTKKFPLQLFTGFCFEPRLDIVP
ncbi:F-box/kelch-repeat protein [Striga hermonthica]|uniref:F-box/kelch-repeat protein n=1 Tax=Striga hermonthica TaxID=68872 RepID=A0A9N7NF40_STRHE|nr:F-box/kelch-repeat protein [Striga hermonthica]